MMFSDGINHVFPMNRFLRIAFIIFFLGFSLAGCQCRRDTTPVRINGNNTQLGDAWHIKEDFDRSFDLINNLDESPSLPGTPGFERLVSIADRLNKWIRHQKPDETWKSDTPFRDIEQIGRAHV